MESINNGPVHSWRHIKILTPHPICVKSPSVVPPLPDLPSPGSPTHPPTHPHHTPSLRVKVDRSDFLLRVEFVHEAQGDVVHEFTHGENRGAQQKTQEATDLAQQTQELKRLVLGDGLEAQLLVEDVHLHEVLPEMTGKNVETGEAVNNRIARFFDPRQTLLCDTCRSDTQNTQNIMYATWRPPPHTHTRTHGLCCCLKTAGQFIRLRHSDTHRSLILIASTEFDAQNTLNPVCCDFHLQVLR